MQHWRRPDQRPHTRQVSFCFSGSFLYSINSISSLSDAMLSPTMTDSHGLHDVWKPSSRLDNAHVDRSTVQLGVRILNGHPTFRCAKYGTWLSNYGVRVRVPNGKLIFRLPHDEFRLLHHVVLMRIPNGNPTFRLPKSNFRLLHYRGFTENP